MSTSPSPESFETTPTLVERGPRFAMSRRLVLLVSALALFSMSASALAAPPAQADVVAAPVAIALNVVHATTEGGGVALDLESIKKWLVKSFPNYSSFKGLSDREDTVGVGNEVKETLPNGTVLAYKHLGWKDGFATISLSVGGLETTVNVKDGKGFLQAGRSYKDGMIVLAFRVQKAP